MEAKAKSGASAPKGAAAKLEKKEPAAPRKPDPAPAGPETEALPAKEDKAEAEAPTEAEEAATPSTDCLEHMKPFLIGGAVVAVGAILVGVLLLARRN